MPLGTEEGLGRGHILLDGDLAPSIKIWNSPPPKKKFFLAHICCGQTAGWIKMPATWYGGRPQPRPRVIDGDPASIPTERGTACMQPPLFGHNRHGPKSGGGCCAPFHGGAVSPPHLTMSPPGPRPTSIRTKWYNPDPSRRLATIDMAQKVLAAVPHSVWSAG